VKTDKGSEGVFALAVTTPRMATAQQMTVLASLRQHRLGRSASTLTVPCETQSDRTHLGADSAVALLRALHHPALQVLVTSQTSDYTLSVLYPSI
jgi:hypothetical protein